MLKSNFLIATVLLQAACATDNEGQVSSRLSGEATYRDAATKHDGTPADPATPTSAEVTVIVKGTGQIPDLDPQCSLDAAGAFEATYLSTLSMEDGSLYAATFASAGSTIQTPSGCAIPDLTVSAITDVVVRGEIEATTTSCKSYCDANARAEAESECGASASAATCRAEAEATAAASCSQTCTTRADKIVAEVSLATSLFTGIDADRLRAAALGELSADLTFDTLVDANGDSL